MLLDIKSIEEPVITDLLRQQGYYVWHLTLAEYKIMDCTQSPHLIIVDAQHHGNEVISTVKDILSTSFFNDSNEVSIFYPHVLSLVHIESSDKQQIFQLGAFDYLSSPLITQELFHRVEQALLSVGHNQIDISNQMISPDSFMAEKIARYLKSKLAHEINLNDLTREMGCNRNKLTGIFKKYFAMTMFQWLREQRMLHAAELLDTTEQSVLQVAEKVGYLDSNNFSTAFKRAFHVSPIHYKKMQQSKKTVQRAKA